MADLPEPLTPADCDLPRSREAAADAGWNRYFTAIPCPAGHVAPRYTLNGYCVVCQREINRADRARLRAKLRRAK